MRTLENNSALRILVVDDEHLIADTIVAILRQHGHEAMAAYDGTEAVERARQYCPDFMISDVFMPGLNGIEAARMVCGICPAVKIILFSGHAALPESLGCEESEFEILPKPVHPATLLERIKQ